MSGHLPATHGEAVPLLLPEQFVQIDEDGYFKLETLRVADREVGHAMLARLRMDPAGRPVTVSGHVPVLVEAFDEPYIALDVEESKSALRWRITMPYGYSEEFDLQTLTLDEWDRFHGRTVRGIPFVFSRSTQARFFSLLDEFEDDAIVVNGTRIPTEPWLHENISVQNGNWWSEKYQNHEDHWELDSASHALASLVPQLKLHRLRVFVPCSGSGNDAAWFAEQGHIVTAVDFSEEAIQRARKKFGHLKNLTFRQADIFKLPTTDYNNYDLLFDHTCYCAINPSRRTELVTLWRRLLVDTGHLMGVFFAMDRPSGPPFGASEWELRSRIEKKNFKPLYWTRLRDSKRERMGIELFVYAQKLPKFAAMI